MITSVLSEKSDTPMKFSIGDKVFVQDNDTYDILEGTVVMPPTTKSKFYTIKLSDDDSLHDASQLNVYN